MTRVYLINLSFGLAGVERRFANIWHTLRRRGNVSPILAIPSTLERALAEADLLPTDRGALRIVREPVLLSTLGRIALPSALHTPSALIRSRASALGFRRVWREIAQDPDAVVHIGMPCSALTPPDAPVVYECMDATFRSFRSGHFRRASKRPCVVHCQSQRIRNGIEAAFSGQETRWLPVTSPAYFAHYADVPAGVVRDPHRVVFVGRLHEIKHPLLFVDAVARARQLGAPVRASMLGEGPLRAAVDARIATHGLTAEVSVGFHAHPSEALAGAAVYASLQHHDNYGSQALLEAMGAGCAVLASDVGETSRLVTSEVGTTVPLQVEAVAVALTQMVMDPEGTRARGAAAAQLVRSKYSADAYAAFLEQLYDEARRVHRATA
jgi:glycosyltransferase involved in cell wall biosynthesis